ncbi:unnamed protein product, partial [Ectocarpus sp. 12 AP-2014]
EVRQRDLSLFRRGKIARLGPLLVGRDSCAFHAGGRSCLVKGEKVARLEPPGIYLVLRLWSFFWPKHLLSKKHRRPVPLFGAALGSTWTRRRVCEMGGPCSLGIYGRRATGMPRIGCERWRYL